VQEKSVDRVDRSPKLSRASIPHEPDIPEALRESSFVQPSHQRFTTLKSLFNSSLLRWGLLGGAIALCISFFQPSFSYILSALPAAIRNASAIVRSQPEVGSATLRSPASTPDPRQSTLPQPTQPFLASPSSSRQALSLTSPLLGHFPYKEVPLQTLQLVVADGSIKLRQAAAAKFLEMVAEAKAERIVLIPISGFRSIADQEYLFFDVKAQQGQGATQRAEVEEIAAQYLGQVKVVKVNTDENPSVASQYGIRSIPTLMIFKGGQRVDMVVGAVPKTTLASTLEKYL
jgi:thioredoxin 1